MNDETLERLIMDATVGGLPPDVEELLDAFLSDRPERRTTASEIAETVGLARRAVSIETAIPDEPLPAPTFLERAAVNANPKRWTKSLAVAAMLIFAFAIGMLIEAQRKPSPLLLVEHQNVRHSSGERVEDASGFWSRARLKRLGKKTPSQDYPKIKWRGPFKGPHIGEAS